MYPNGGPGRNGRLAIMAAFVLVSAFGFDVQFAQGSFTKKMIGISENLEKALSDVLETSEIRYTEPRLNASYDSTTEFCPKGMQHLYNLTTMFIDVIQKKQAYPEGLLEVHDGHIELAGDLAEEWQTVATHYAGILALVIVVLLMAILLPIIGFCFCCCRCAGKCGARSQPFDKKHDKCRKFMLATFLICITTLFMFGLVCTFVTNSRMNEGVHTLPDTARAGLSDSRTYLRTTNQHMHTLLTDNYNELQASLLNMLKTGGARVSDQLAEFSKAVSVTTLNTMVHDLGQVKKNLIQIRNVTNLLRDNASQLNDGLRKVKRELLHTLKTCERKQCQDILNKYKIGELDTSGIDFSQLPDVSELLARVSTLIDGNIQDEVMEGQKVFDDIKSSIERSVNEQIPVLESAIENAGKEISQFSQKLDKVMENADSAINHAGPKVDLAEKYIYQYSIYVWYVGLGICCILLLILTFVVMGLLCGICGKRPDGYGDDCCNKGAGSQFLMLAVAMMFLLGIVVIVVTLAYFLVGVVTQRALCDSLRNPQDDQLFMLIDEVVNLEQIVFKEKVEDFNMSYVVTSCHQNKTIYEVLRLDKVIDLEKLRAKSEKELQDKIKVVYKSISFDHDYFVILKNSAKDKLVELSKSGLSDFPFDRFTQVLVTNITSIDLMSLAKQLKDTADKISKQQGFAEVTVNLRNQALHLETYQLKLVNPMVREAETLNDTAIELRDGLKFNHSSFTDAVLSLIAETEEAEKYLTVQGPEAIKNLTRVFASSIAAQVSEYLNRVVEHVQTKVGKCAPMSEVYNATLNASCNKILLPFNGFWFASGWCILLFIPLIIISVKLATLYQKSDPYPGPLVEAKGGDLQRNSSNIEDKIRDFEAKRGQTLTVDMAKFKQPSEVSKSPRTSFGRPIKFSFKSSYSSEFESKIDDRTLPIGTKYSSKDECYMAIVPEKDAMKNATEPTKDTFDKQKKADDNDKVIARETAVCIVDSVLDSAKNIVETKLVDKPFKENLDVKKSIEKQSPSSIRSSDSKKKQTKGVVINDKAVETIEPREEFDEGVSKVEIELKSLPTVNVVRQTVIGPSDGGSSKSTPVKSQSDRVKVDNKQTGKDSDQEPNQK